MRIRDVFKERKSVYNFREDFIMNKNDFEAIIELARHSPTIYNTQGMHYLVTMDKEKQQKLKEICKGQHKISTASGVILVLSERDFLNENFLNEIYGHSLNLGLINEDDFGFMKKQMKDLLNSEGYLEKEYELELYRNAFINAGMLISIITVLGFDTCPMHVHNTEEIRKLFNVPNNLEILFMLPVGMGVDKSRPKGYKRQLGEVLTFESFE